MLLETFEFVIQLTYKTHKKWSQIAEKVFVASIFTLEN